MTNDERIMDNLFVNGIATEYSEKTRKVVAALEHVDEAAKLILEGRIDESGSLLELRELAIRDLEDISNTLLLLEAQITKDYLESMKLTDSDNDNSELRDIVKETKKSEGEGLEETPYDDEAVGSEDSEGIEGEAEEPENSEDDAEEDLMSLYDEEAESYEDDTSEARKAYAEIADRVHRLVEGVNSEERDKILGELREKQVMHRNILEK